jgi:hypothetical protein
VAQSKNSQLSTLKFRNKPSTMEAGKMRFERKVCGFELLPIKGDGKVYLEDIGKAIDFVSSIYYHLCLAYFRTDRDLVPIRQVLLSGNDIGVVDFSQMPVGFRLTPLSISSASPWTVIFEAIGKVFDPIKKIVIPAINTIQEYHKARSEKWIADMNREKARFLPEKQKISLIQDEVLKEIMVILKKKMETEFSYQRTMQGLEILDRTVDIMAKIDAVFSVPENEKKALYLPIVKQLMSRWWVEHIINPIDTDKLT